MDPPLTVPCSDHLSKVTVCGFWVLCIICEMWPYLPLELLGATFPLCEWVRAMDFAVTYTDVYRLAGELLQQIFSTQSY